MERDQLADIHIRNPVAPGQQEGLIAEIGLQALDAPAGERLGPGFAYDEIVPAVERLIAAYLDVRLNDDETFLAAYRRLGPAPFKAAVYPEAQSSAAA